MKWTILVLLIFNFLKISPGGEIKATYSEKLHNYLMLKIHIINPLEKKFGKLYITSIFRSWPKNSQHTTWQAIDIDDYKRNYTNRNIYKFVRDSLSSDQLIWEFGTNINPRHVHISYNHNNNRHETLRAYQGKYKVWYKIIT